MMGNVTFNIGVNGIVACIAITIVIMWYIATKRILKNFREEIEYWMERVGLAEALAKLDEMKIKMLECDLEVEKNKNEILRKKYETR